MTIQQTVESPGQLEALETDPILSNAILPIQKIFYPLGFPLELHTNSEAVLEAAQQCWGQFTQRFSCATLTLRIGVVKDSGNSVWHSPTPVCRAQGNLLSNIADPHNFIITDLDAGFSFGFITQQTATSSLYLRYHFLEAAALCMISVLHAVPLHAACVEIFGHGMLLCGESGAGKSSLAFAGARAGWTFISDDASYLLLEERSRVVIGNCYQVRLRASGVTLFPELEGLPVTSRAAGKPSIEVPTSDFPNMRTAESSTVQSIIYLNRKTSAPPGLFPYSRQTDLSWLNKLQLQTSESYPVQESAIRHLLSAEIYELRYQDLDWAIDRLQKLAIKGT